MNFLLHVLSTFLEGFGARCKFMLKLPSAVLTLKKTLSSQVNYSYAKRHQSIDDVVFKRHWIVLYLAFIALFRIFYPSLYLTVRQLLLTVRNSAEVLDMTGPEKLFLL